MRKVFLKLTGVTVTVDVDESMSMEDVLSNLGIESLDESLGMTVTDYEIEDFEVTDSK